MGESRQVYHQGDVHPILSTIGLSNSLSGKALAAAAPQLSRTPLRNHGEALVLQRLPLTDMHPNQLRNSDALNPENPSPASSPEGGPRLMPSLADSM